MRLEIFYTVFFSLITGILCAQTAYNFKITTPDQQQHSLNEYAGKRILLLVIPSTHTLQDSVLLDSATTLAKAYRDSITIIGTPSYEDGYYDDSLPSLTAWYDSLTHGSFIIAQGVSTRKSSAYQDALFAWCTNTAQNGHFDEDVKGAGEMFFIDQTGDLYGVFGPEMQLSSALIEQMLRTSSPNQ